MLKNILLILFSSYFSYACISYDVEQIACSHIDRIEIVNRLGDRTIPRSIILVDKESTNKFCALINDRTFAGTFELKINKGFFDVTVVMDNGKEYNFNTVETFDHGIVIRYKMRHYKQLYVHDYIYEQFRKRK
ncbi:hypothetical protein WG954_18290 [Lacibacter sp. H375]|uniref:hypothetical protein n=1 Tax=Lacibacter sp. H375 TaxID=3133424 RepID=UPI0030C0E379